MNAPTNSLGYNVNILDEVLNCDACGKIVAFGYGDFNSTKIVCPECVKEINLKAIDERERV